MDYRQDPFFQRSSHSPLRTVSPSQIYGQASPSYQNGPDPAFYGTFQPEITIQVQSRTPPRIEPQNVLNPDSVYLDDNDPLNS